MDNVTVDTIIPNRMARVAGSRLASGHVAEHRPVHCVIFAPPLKPHPQRNATFPRHRFGCAACTPPLIGINREDGSGGSGQDDDYPAASFIFAH